MSIEYGLSEMLNNQVIEPSIIPKDGDWFPDTSQLEAIFPEETRDHSVTPIYQQVCILYLFYFISSISVYCS